MLSDLCYTFGSRCDNVLFSLQMNTPYKCYFAALSATRLQNK